MKEIRRYINIFSAVFFAFIAALSAEKGLWGISIIFQILSINVYVAWLFVIRDKQK